MEVIPRVSIYLMTNIPQSYPLAWLGTPTAQVTLNVKKLHASVNVVKTSPRRITSSACNCMEKININRNYNKISIIHHKLFIEPTMVFTWVCRLRNRRALGKESHSSQTLSLILINNIYQWKSSSWIGKKIYTELVNIQRFQWWNNKRKSHIILCLTILTCWHLCKSYI